MTSTLHLTIQAPSWARELEVQEYVVVVVATNLKHDIRRMEWTQQANYLHSPRARVALRFKVPKQLVEQEYSYWQVALLANFTHDATGNHRTAVLGATRFYLGDLQVDTEPDYATPVLHTGPDQPLMGTMTRDLVAPLWPTYKPQIDDADAVTFFRATIRCPLDADQAPRGSNDATVVPLHHARHLENYFLTYQSLLLQHLETIDSSVGMPVESMHDRAIARSTGPKDLTLDEAKRTRKREGARLFTPTFSAVPGVYYSPGPFMMPITNTLEIDGEVAYGSHGSYGSLFCAPLRIPDEEVRKTGAMMRAFLRMRQWFFGVTDQMIEDVAAGEPSEQTELVVECALNALNGFAMGIMYGADLELTQRKLFPSDHTFENSGVDDCEGLANRTVKIARTLLELVNNPRYTVEPILRYWAMIVEQYDIGLAICSVTQSDLGSDTEAFGSAKPITDAIVERAGQLASELKDIGDSGADVTPNVLHKMREYGEIVNDHIQLGGHGTVIALKRDDAEGTTPDWPLCMYIEGTAMAFNSKKTLQPDIDMLSLMQLCKCIRIDMVPGFVTSPELNEAEQMHVRTHVNHLIQSYLSDLFAQTPRARKELKTPTPTPSPDDDNDNDDDDSPVTQREMYQHLLDAIKPMLWKQFIVAVRSICVVSPQQLNAAQERFADFHRRAMDDAGDLQDDLDRLFDTSNIGFKHVTPVLECGEHGEVQSVYAGVPANTFDITTCRRYGWKTVRASSTERLHRDLGEAVTDLEELVPDTVQRGRLVEQYALFLPGYMQPTFMPTKLQQYHNSPSFTINHGFTTEMELDPRLCWIDFAQTQIRRIRKCFRGATVFADIPAMAGKPAFAADRHFLEMYQHGRLPSSSSEIDKLPTPFNEENRLMLHGKWFHLHRSSNAVLTQFAKMLRSMYRSVVLYIHVINPSTDVGEFALICHEKRDP